MRIRKDFIIFPIDLKIVFMLKKGKRKRLLSDDDLIGVEKAEGAKSPNNLIGDPQ